MNDCKRIFIIGHPGTGKGLIVKMVAEQLGWQFIDADFGLEFHIGRTLPTIISTAGANAFHDCEFEVLTSLVKQENIVITTDASIVCSEKNRQLLSKEFTVYLKVDASTQIERLARRDAPLLRIDDVKKFLNTLHDERDGLYEEVASLLIDTNDNDVDKHIANILSTVSKSKQSRNDVSSLSLDKKDLTIFHKKTHAPVHLSDQQAKCLKLLAQGNTSKEIARDLNISYRTVEGHIANMMELLGCSSSKELIALYYDLP